jgi:hypothetical protein
VRLNSHSIWSSPRALGWLIESGWGQFNLESSILIFQQIWKISRWWHLSPVLEPWIQIPMFWNKGSKESWHAIFIAESRVVSSPRAWELDESHRVCLVFGGASPRA